MKYCMFCQKSTVPKRGTDQIVIGILLIILLTIIGGAIYLACCDKKICSICSRNYIESGVNFDATNQNNNNNQNQNQSESINKNAKTE